MRTKRTALIVLLIGLATITASMLAKGAEETKNGAVTFNKDVLPLLQKNCQTCHRPGEIAPMSFLT